MNGIPDGFALRLSDGAECRDQKVVAGFAGAELLLVKVDFDAQKLEPLDRFQKIHRIPGKPTDGLHQHNAKAVVVGVYDHFPESPARRVAAGIAVGINFVKRPFRMQGGLVLQHGYLRFKALVLRTMFRADPAVDGNIYILFRQSGYDVHPPLGQFIRHGRTPQNSARSSRKPEYVAK
jgi:hypothetical protein